ncbi:MAG: LysM peptidoglycan-binding domain-containing protein [Alistipes sp.]|nr:LysM peptidoglycan-binding domain-containing protein [Alistipes sp.]
MKIRSLLIALVSVGAVAMASAQDVVVVNGVKYAIHDVQRGETLYALSRRYGVTIEEITSANQVLLEGLKVGQRIKIPVKSAVADAQQPATATAKTHKVAKRETLYSLAKRYDVTIDELYEANPGLKKGLKAGQIIVIPQKSEQKQEQKAEKVEIAQVATPTPEPVKTTPMADAPEAKKPEQKSSTIYEQIISDWQSKSTQPFRTLLPGNRAEVALLLPLGSEEQPSQNYLDFYRGFLMGLDSVRMAGHSVNLNLYNTAHDHERVSAIIASGELNKADLVVGPIYEDELIPVATALQSKGTPIVSPLANLTQTTSNSVFQMSPSPTSKLDKVRGMFDGSKRVVIISTDNVDREFDAEVRQMLRDTSYVVQHKYIYEHPSVIEKREKEREKLREKMLAEGLDITTLDETPSPSDMSPLLQGNEPTVIVITADNEVEVDRILAAIASANISLTARSQRVAPFVVFGNNRWNRYRNIDRSIFFTNNVVMLSTYHARRSDAKIHSFDKRFVEEFGALPSLYAYRGYDAAVVFVQSLYGTMETGLEGVLSMPLLTPYVFEENNATGVRINSQWIKVNYNSNFTITTE